MHQKDIGNSVFPAKDYLIQLSFFCVMCKPSEVFNMGFYVEIHYGFEIKVLGKK